MKKSIIKKNFKKGLFFILLAASLGSASSPVFAAQLSSTMQKQVASNPEKQIPPASEIKTITDTLLFVNGNQVQLPNGIISYKDSTYLPMRQLGELLGADTTWFEQEKVAQLYLNERGVEVLNQTNIGVWIQNDQPGLYPIVADIKGDRRAPIPALNINGSVYLPIRYISTTLGVEINYDNPHPETRTKTITVGQRTGLNYKLPEAPQGVHPINVGKVPTAPDGVDYNAKYLDYLLQKKQFTDKAGNATPVPTADFNKLFSQTHPKTGAKAIPGLFQIEKGFFLPVFDHDGDGKIGDTKISDLSIADLDKVQSNSIKEDEKSQVGFKGISYKFEFYNRYTYDGQFMNWFIKGEYVGPNK